MFQEALPHCSSRCAYGNCQLAWPQSSQQPAEDAARACVQCLLKPFKAVPTSDTVNCHAGLTETNSLRPTMAWPITLLLQVNRGSSVPRKLRYVTGLRGGPDSKVKVVALELDVHGQGAIVRHKPPGRL